MIRSPGLLLDFEGKSSPCPVTFWNVSPQGLRDESSGSRETERTFQPLPLVLNCVSVAKWHNISDPFLLRLSKAGSVIIPDIIFIFIIIHSPAVVTQCTHVKNMQWATPEC